VPLLLQTPESISLAPNITNITEILCVIDSDSD
jgi:hypothetical protein